jgi:hypothetical protein
MLFGIAGTGGASTALGTGAAGLDGDGSRNVRSVMDPELPLRCNCDPGRAVPDTELPIEDVEPLLFIVRFVCTSATDVGIDGLARNAAAAAAAERDTFEAWLFRKAWAAAVVADALALGPLRGGFDAALLFRLPNIVDTEAECLLHLCQPRTNEDTIATRKIIDGKLREKL